MSTLRNLLVLTAGGLIATAPVIAQPQSAAPSRTIVENASATPSLSTLVSAVKAAGLVETLSGPGPFTVFAPADPAFSALPAGTVDTLLKPENKGQLTSVLTYHVVPGRVTAQNLMQQIKTGGGTATLKTVQGAELKASLSGNSVVITDAAGGTATVTTADVQNRNGIVHVIDKVLMPM
ncbi:fasciclin domain-containing protein [Sphingomonas turrisvirgatae]|uniref:FAS1 domain-containing protein n=1 Tax=Sphingomonas turrisvirgatae TaxID=1888892 RepID=A0A1E3LXH4_9SPHN|nr:fasciclin domain-containing protein [Sphingomonas turrisvirgatae]ODP38522.1 hypothetical protein BFL28_00260 [Sphingomonas turrisvirgatae]